MKSNRVKKKSFTGFTLVEVITTLVILALIAAIAIPSLVGYIDSAREKAAVEECRIVVEAASDLATDYALETGVIAYSGNKYNVNTEVTSDAIISLSEAKGTIEKYSFNPDDNSSGYTEPTYLVNQNEVVVSGAKGIELAKDVSTLAVSVDDSEYEKYAVKGVSLTYMRYTASNGVEVIYYNDGYAASGVEELSDTHVHIMQPVKIHKELTCTNDEITLFKCTEEGCTYNYLSVTAEAPGHNVEAIDEKQHKCVRSTVTRHKVEGGKLVEYEDITYSCNSYDEDNCGTAGAHEHKFGSMLVTQEAFAYENLNYTGKAIVTETVGDATSDRLIEYTEENPLKGKYTDIQYCTVCGVLKCVKYDDTGVTNKGSGNLIRIVNKNNKEVITDSNCEYYLKSTSGAEVGPFHLVNGYLVDADGNGIEVAYDASGNGVTNSNKVYANSTGTTYTLVENTAVNGYQAIAGGTQITVKVSSKNNGTFEGIELGYNTNNAYVATDDSKEVVIPLNPVLYFTVKLQGNDGTSLTEGVYTLEDSSGNPVATINTNGSTYFVTGTDVNGGSVETTFTFDEGVRFYISTESALKNTKDGIPTDELYLSVGTWKLYETTPPNGWETIGSDKFVQITVAANGTFEATLQSQLANVSLQIAQAGFLEYDLDTQYGVEGGYNGTTKYARYKNGEYSNPTLQIEYKKTAEEDDGNGNIVHIVDENGNGISGGEYYLVCQDGSKVGPLQLIGGYLKDANGNNLKLKYGAPSGDSSDTIYANQYGYKYTLKATKAIEGYQAIASNTEIAVFVNTDDTLKELNTYSKQDDTVKIVNNEVQITLRKLLYFTMKFQGNDGTNTTSLKNGVYTLTDSSNNPVATITVDGDSYIINGKNVEGTEVEEKLTGGARFYISESEMQDSNDGIPLESVCLSDHVTYKLYETTCPNGWESIGKNYPISLSTITDGKYFEVPLTVRYYGIDTDTASIGFTNEEATENNGTGNSITATAESGECNNPILLFEYNTPTESTVNMLNDSDGKRYIVVYDGADAADVTTLKVTYTDSDGTTHTDTASVSAADGTCKNKDGSDTKYTKMKHYSVYGVSDGKEGYSFAADGTRKDITVQLLAGDEVVAEKKSVDGETVTKNDSDSHISLTSTSVKVKFTSVPEYVKSNPNDYLAVINGKEYSITDALAGVRITGCNKNTTLSAKIITNDSNKTTVCQEQKYNNGNKIGEVGLGKTYTFNFEDESVVVKVNLTDSGDVTYDTEHMTVEIGGKTYTMKDALAGIRLYSPKKATIKIIGVDGSTLSSKNNVDLSKCYGETYTYDYSSEDTITIKLDSTKYSDLYKYINSVYVKREAGALSSRTAMEITVNKTFDEAPSNSVIVEIGGFASSNSNGTTVQVKDKDGNVIAQAEPNTGIDKFTGVFGGDITVTPTCYLFNVSTAFTDTSKLGSLTSATLTVENISNTLSNTTVAINGTATEILVIPADNATELEFTLKDSSGKTISTETVTLDTNYLGKVQNVTFDAVEEDYTALIVTASDKISLKITFNCDLASEVSKVVVTVQNSPTTVDVSGDSGNTFIVKNLATNPKGWGNGDNIKIELYDADNNVLGETTLTSADYSWDWSNAYGKTIPVIVEPKVIKIYAKLPETYDYTGKKIVCNGITKVLNSNNDSLIVPTDLNGMTVYLTTDSQYNGVITTATISSVNCSTYNGSEYTVDFTKQFVNIKFNLPSGWSTGSSWISMNGDTPGVTVTEDVLKNGIFIIPTGTSSLIVKIWQGNAYWSSDSRTASIEYEAWKEALEKGTTLEVKFD